MVFDQCIVFTRVRTNPTEFINPSVFRVLRDRMPSQPGHRSEYGDTILSEKCHFRDSHDGGHSDSHCQSSDPCTELDHAERRGDRDIYRSPEFYDSGDICITQKSIRYLSRICGQHQYTLLTTIPSHGRPCRFRHRVVRGSCALVSLVYLPTLRVVRCPDGRQRICQCPQLGCP